MVEYASAPHSEQERLSVLDSFGILDSEPEQGFDDIVLLARQICSAPIALISLVAEHRQWFKAVSGLDASETPLSQSVCWHVLQQTSTLIVPDMTKDERTRTNPLVTGERHFRFYAGALLTTTSGVAIGTLCVIDVEPRPAGLSESEVRALEALARQVIAQLELRRAMTAGETAFAQQGRKSDVFEARAIASERSTALLQANDLRQRMAQEIGKVGTFDIDVASNRITATEEFCRIFGLPYRPAFDFSEVEALVLPADQSVVSTADKRQRGDVTAHIEFRIRRPPADTVVWISRQAQVLNGATGAPQRIVGAVRDISERKAIEDRQRVLNEELSHRMKNTLSLVQAIASQTLRGVSDRPAVHAFGQRINALSHAHDILLQQDWNAANMMDVFKGVMGLHGDVGRFSLTGPVINLGPKAALSLSLLLHELATNAVKYGALSVPQGHIDVTWSQSGPDLVIDWRERNGPPAVPPTRVGLGSRLIDMGLSGSGMVSKRYDESGFAVEFKAPLDLIKY